MGVRYTDDEREEIKLAAGYEPASAYVRRVSLERARETGSESQVANGQRARSAPQDRPVKRVPAGKVVGSRGDRGTSPRAGAGSRSPRGTKSKGAN